MFECKCTLEARPCKQLVPRKIVFTETFVRDSKTSERLHMKPKIAAAANKVYFYDNALSI